MSLQTKPFNFTRGKYFFFILMYFFGIKKFL